MITMMYMYSTGLPFVPFYPIPSSYVPIPPLYARETSQRQSPNITREELLVSGFKSLKCPTGILGDPQDPAPASDGSVYGVECAAAGQGLPARDGAEKAACTDRPSSVQDKKQLKFGIDAILGNRGTPAADNTEKRKGSESIETLPRYPTSTSVTGTERHINDLIDQAITGHTITGHAWQTGCTEDGIPCYPSHGRTGEHAVTHHQLQQLPVASKFSSATDYCQGCCYQDKSAVTQPRREPWSYVPYTYRLEPNPPYSIKEHLTATHAPHHQAGHPAPSARLAGRRKRSWSRAVFTSLQRKGLEKRFEMQKYVNKPDRRQLAAALGLTDAQVKVWFQNRRMKWRHFQRMQKQQQQAADTSSTGAAARLTDDCSCTDEEGPTEERGVLPVGNQAGPKGRDRFSLDNDRGIVKDTRSWLPE